METLLTHSGFIINQPGSSLKNTSAFIFLVALNTTQYLPVQPTNSIVPSSQIYAWERQLPNSGRLPIPEDSGYHDPSDIFMKPTPVRRYKVKGRIRSVRKGVVH